MDVDPVTPVHAHPSARYDGHADWYDSWSRTDAAAFMCTADQALGELAPEGTGLAIDVGCGTGLRGGVATRRGFQVAGLDFSIDQLRLAGTRLAVIRADGRALPLATGSARWVYSVLTHTDLERFHQLVAEAVRLLSPGGSFVYVGVHPCFNHPFAEPVDDGLRVHPGYRDSGWKLSTPYRPGVVTRRVGVHHLPLEGLLTALLHPDAPIDRVIERGGGAIPDLIGVRLTRPDS